MQSWNQIVVDLQLNWWLYLSMPFVAALIGYVTKIVAIKMMFEPIEFIGIRPFLGWQGIVPRKAAVMAAIACDTMTTKLIKPEDVFSKLDPDRIAKEIEKPLFAAVEDITREIASQYSPGLWEVAPEAVKRLVVQRIRDESPNLIRQIMIDIQSDIGAVFDLKDMVITNLMGDKRLLNRIFLEAGSEEFRFIRNSGIWFGFIIGVVQAVTWALTQNPWVMPLFGLFTGWFTDWLALRMVFYPKRPTRYLGVFTWQGLFLKRRREVSIEYGRLITSEIVTPRKIFDAVLRGPLSDRLLHMVQKQVQKVIDEQSGVAKPFVVFAVGSGKYQEMKRVAAASLMQRLPDAMVHVEAYTAEAMDLERTLATKMTELTPEEFEALLHPAFEQDEWMLIAVGATLGFLVGEIQVFVMEHLARHPVAQAALSLLN